MANPYKSRYIKLVSFTFNDMGDVEKKVNGTINSLRKAGGIIISIVPHNFGVNPIRLMYNIIYEAETEITDQMLAEADKKD